MGHWVNVKCCNLFYRKTNIQRKVEIFNELKYEKIKCGFCRIHCMKIKLCVKYFSREKSIIRKKAFDGTKKDYQNPLLFKISHTLQGMTLYMYLASFNTAFIFSL